ncbi:hypothetical protein [Flavonifractor plautii]|jgi:hypothetical protein|uniref:hypothetical protein n=1 Tax=Flavonifractor plautii TaxID=292800 RepID=UPI00189A111D|nr:hypothetical protein [Flavonifractor plautii]
MAERRMFAKTIIDSDAFLDMPLSTQALYFHLSMRADDEGFVNNPKKIQRMTGASDDDVKLLIAKRFVIPFESGVCVIKHWLIHNYIQKDRFKPTVYKDERASLVVKQNKSYSLVDTDCIQDVSSMETQVRLGKSRIGKVSLGEGSIGECEGETAGEPPAPPPVPYERIKKIYNSLCPSFSRCTALSEARRKAIKARFASGYTIEDFQQLFTKAEASSFLKGRNSRNWTASFDWLIKDANMAKVLDGNYDDHHPGSPTRNDDLDFIPD